MLKSLDLSLVPTGFWDNQLICVNTEHPPLLPSALFNKLLSPPAPPAIDKEIRMEQIKTWSRDNPRLLFTQRPKSAKSSSDTVKAPKSSVTVN